jgi:hypothetical protein
LKIEDIPDYPALQQVTRALWKIGKARGAAIFVGAGFSRNAALIHEDAPAPPLWSDLVVAMETRTYPNGGSSQNPLRLAEEFKAVLGASALESLIRELVRDDEWQPGDLHKKLVRLPWTDILTTNWDTLIERAARANLDRTYETVRCVSDIATTRAPRVVKLHGSLPSNRPFILSEEDFRTYPRVFAPFVNLVQQVLLENELCLLGFSGDDPNFLEWSGWVRDQLGASARRIYLVGALKLSSARRKLLESRNISIVDFSPLLANVDDATRERCASELFINHLLSSKPRPVWDWPIEKKPALSSALENRPEQQVDQLRNTIVCWEEERVSYPGWFVCPPNIRQEIARTTINALWSMKSTLEQLPLKDRGRAAFEAAWRLDKAFVPVPPWVRDVFQALAESDENWADQKEHAFLATVLLRTAREERNSSEFERWSNFLETQGQSDTKLLTSVLYERCLWARDALDFRELRRLLEGLAGNDPAWKLRRAMFHCDLGETEIARTMVAQALFEIRERLYQDRDSIWVLSRMAWAQFLYHGIRSWNSAEDEAASEWQGLGSQFHEAHIDPWETIHAFERKIEEDLRKVAERRRTKEAQFDAGTYRDHSSKLYFGTWWPESAIYEIGRLAEIVGVPARADHSFIMSPRMERAEVLVDYKYEDDANFLRLLRIAQSGADDLLERAFGRIQVARLTSERVEMLRITLSRALDYALERLTQRKGFGDDFWSGHAARYVEILSRLSVRFGEEDAIALFRDGLRYARDPRWKALELFKPLAHLLERSFSAIPPSSRSNFITELIQLPLPEEEGIPQHLERDWPESAEWLPESLMRRPTSDAQFADRVATLIEKTQTSATEGRSRGARRLAQLYLAGVLTAEEGIRFGVALWARRNSDDELPADTNLYSHMFLLLPSPDKGKAHGIFTARSNERSFADFLISLSGAAHRRNGGSHRLVLTEDKALEVLDAVLAWHPRPEGERILGEVRRENGLCRTAIGPALADAILPALNPQILSAEIIDKCF